MTSISKKTAMNKQAVIEYIENNGYAEIPSIQRKFKMSYRQVRDIVAELTANKKLVFKDGIRYDSTVVKIPKDAHCEFIQPDRHGGCRVRITRSDIASESATAFASDRESQMEKLLWELRGKRLEEIRRNLCKTLEPEVKDWLTNAFIADKDLTLKQASKQAQSELTRARKSGNVNAIRTYTNVTCYLSTCDGLTFDQLKKSLLK